MKASDVHERDCVNENARLFGIENTTRLHATADENFDELIGKKHARTTVADETTNAHMNSACKRQPLDEVVLANSNNKTVDDEDETRSGFLLACQDRIVVDVQPAHRIDVHDGNKTISCPNRRQQQLLLHKVRNEQQQHQQQPPPKPPHIPRHHCSLTRTAKCCRRLCISSALAIPLLPPPLPAQSSSSAARRRRLRQKCEQQQQQQQQVPLRLHSRAIFSPCHHPHLHHHKHHNHQHQLNKTPSSSPSSSSLQSSFVSPRVFHLLSWQQSKMMLLSCMLLLFVAFAPAQTFALVGNAIGEPQQQQQQSSSSPKRVVPLLASPPTAALAGGGVGGGGGGAPPASKHPIVVDVGAPPSSFSAKIAKPNKLDAAPSPLVAQTKPSQVSPPAAYRDRILPDFASTIVKNSVIEKPFAQQQPSVSFSQPSYFAAQQLKQQKPTVVIPQPKHAAQGLPTQQSSAFADAGETRHASAGGSNKHASSLSPSNAMQIVQNYRIHQRAAVTLVDTNCGKQAGCVDGGGLDFNPLLAGGSSLFAGIKARLNPRGFQYASLNGCLTVYNLYVSRYRCPQRVIVYPAPPNQIVISVENMDIGLTGNLGGQITVIVPLSLFGIVQVNVHQASIRLGVVLVRSVDGFIQLQVASCSISVGFVDVYVENGGLLGDLASSQFRPMLSKYIRQKILQEGCSRIAPIIDQEINPRLKQKIPQSIPLTTLLNSVMNALDLNSILIAATSAQTCPSSCAGAKLNKAVVAAATISTFSDKKSSEKSDTPANIPVHVASNSSSSSSVTSLQSNSSSSSSATIVGVHDATAATPTLASSSSSAAAAAARKAKAAVAAVASQEAMLVVRSSASNADEFAPEKPSKNATQVRVTKGAATTLSSELLPSQSAVVGVENTKKLSLQQQQSLLFPLAAVTKENANNNETLAPPRAMKPFVLYGGKKIPNRLAASRIVHDGKAISIPGFMRNPIKRRFALSKKAGIKRKALSAGPTVVSPISGIGVVGGGANSIAFAEPGQDPCFYCPHGGSSESQISTLLHIVQSLDMSKISSLYLTTQLVRAYATSVDYTVELNGEFSQLGQGGTPFSAFPTEFAQNPGHKMLDIVVSDFTLNSLLYHLHRSGFINIQIGPETPKVGALLKTTCSSDDDTELEDHGVESIFLTDEVLMATAHRLRQRRRRLRRRRSPAAKQRRRAKREGRLVTAPNADDAGGGTSGELGVCLGDIIPSIHDRYPNELVQIVAHTSGRAPSVILSGANGGEAVLQLTLDADFYLQGRRQLFGTIRADLCLQFHLLTQGRRVAARASVCGLQLTDVGGQLGLSQEALDNLGNLGKEVLVKAGNDVLEKGFDFKPPAGGVAGLPLNIIEPEVWIVDHGINIGADFTVTPQGLAEFGGADLC